MFTLKLSRKAKRRRFAQIFLSTYFERFLRYLEKTKEHKHTAHQRERKEDRKKSLS